MITIKLEIEYNVWQNRANIIILTIEISFMIHCASDFYLFPYII